MRRIPEPELMTDIDQVQAYAGADFEEPHERFIELLRERLPALPERGTALDLGCGPGDIAARFVRAFPAWQVHGLDGSQPMLELGKRALRAAGLDAQVSLHHGHLPGGEAPLDVYDLVYSNSLLHHLADPHVLWQSVVRWSREGGPVFVMDLLRPEAAWEVQRLVETYSRDEPEALRRDFSNSLLAAYRPDEVLVQLARTRQVDLDLQVVSDRHFVVWGSARLGRAGE